MLLLEHTTILIQLDYNLYIVYTNMNPWLAHLKKFYNANKSKMSYKQAMKEAKKTYKGESKKKKK